MRSVINISLPEDKAKIIKNRAKKAGFASVSGYVRSLLALDEELVSPEELLEMSRQAEKEYKSGKLVKVKSLASLLKSA
jgi:Arc/MetJ-type ribon-helix-helix transcriptional regulator